MAKSKRTINDIQKALMSTTKYIKEADIITKEKDEKPVNDTPPTQEVNIDPLTMKKLKILAPYLGETTDEIINKALNHFLRLKSQQLDQAIEKLTSE
jgi:hypothetical protein